MGGPAAALSDAADPHWRGQESTPPAPMERTIAEQVIAEWDFVDESRAGQPYRIHVQWKYDRFTTGAPHHFAMDEQQTNIHTTRNVQITTPEIISSENDLLWVKAEFTRADLSTFTGPDLYAFVVFQAPQGLCFVTPLADDGTGIDDQADDGIYSGALSLQDTFTPLAEAGQRATGTWRVNVFAQDVNRVAPGTPPHIAAQTIGGAFVASALQVTFDPSLPCPLESQATIDVV
jgi:hypothetical protein